MEKQFGLNAQIYILDVKHLKNMIDFLIFLW